MSKQRTLVVVRHAITPHNTMIDERGSAELATALERAVARGMNEQGLARLLRTVLKRDYRSETLTTITGGTGQAQCAAAKKAFDKEGLTFKACLRSPYRRAIQT